MVLNAPKATSTAPPASSRMTGHQTCPVWGRVGSVGSGSETGSEEGSEGSTEGSEGTTLGSERRTRVRRIQALRSPVLRRCCKHRRRCFLRHRRHSRPERRFFDPPVSAYFVFFDRNWCATCRRRRSTCLNLWPSRTIFIDIEGECFGTGGRIVSTHFFTMVREGVEGGVGSGSSGLSGSSPEDSVAFTAPVKVT